MYYVSAQGFDEHMINVHYYYFSLIKTGTIIMLSNYYTSYHGKST